jgi:hypothetical protein
MMRQHPTVEIWNRASLYACARKFGVNILEDAIPTTPRLAKDIIADLHKRGVITVIRNL